MRRLTQEQRAARRVTRINNRARRELPLLAWGGEQPTTSYETELAAVQGHDESHARWCARLDAADEARFREAMALRAKVAERVCIDELSFIDSLVASVSPFGASAYVLEAWSGYAAREWPAVDPWEQRWPEPYDLLRIALWRGDEAAAAAAREAIRAEAAAKAAAWRAR